MQGWAKVVLQLESCNMKNNTRINCILYTHNFRPTFANPAFNAPDPVPGTGYVPFLAIILADDDISSVVSITITATNAAASINWYY